MKNTNWLANIFVWLHSVIEEADKPISLVVMVILPFIAPLLPAIITAQSLSKFMEFEIAETWIAVISFELIGYLGMIAVVGALMRLVNNKDDKKIPVLKMNFNFYLFAYVIYLLTLLISNAIFEFVNGASLTRVAVILCLTVGLSVSAGILNASRIYDRDESDDDFVIRQEKREDRMKRLALKQGINVFANDSASYIHNAQTDVQDTQVAVKNKDWRVVAGKLSKRDIKWLQDAHINEICKKYNLTRRTAYLWKERAGKM